MGTKAGNVVQVYIVYRDNLCLPLSWGTDRNGCSQRLYLFSVLRGQGEFIWAIEQAKPVLYMGINMKKNIKICIGLLIIAGAILMVNKLLTYVLVDDAGDEVKYAMLKLYEQEDIETLFLGSSHVFCGYDPQTLDEIMGQNTYLAATPVQKVDGSYYLLKEVIKKNDIKTVYLDVYYRQYRDVPKERSDIQMEYIYCITDNMQPGFNRIEFILNASGPERYLEGLLVPSRYGNQLLDLQRFERVVKSKRSGEYPYSGKPDNFYKGAMITLQSTGNPEMISKIGKFDLARIQENVISDYSLSYLDRIVSLCNEEGIELILVATPLTDFHLAAMGNYDLYYDYMKAYARENNIEYYDFSLCRNEVLQLSRECFLDIHHLSGKGAVEYSRVFANIMTNYDKEEREKFFYSSVEEKLAALPRQTFGIYLEEDEDTCFVGVAANYPIDAEYKIVSVDEEGNEIELIQDFSGESKFIVRKQNREWLKIVVREKKTGRICEEGIIKL